MAEVVERERQAVQVARIPTVTFLPISRGGGRLLRDQMERAKVDAKQAAAVVAVFLYGIGIVVVRSHLLRYGVNDISPLQVRYIAVGITVAASLLPAIVFVSVGECWVSPARRDLAIGLGVSALALAIGLVVFQWRFKLEDLVLNVSAYPYPRSYILSNILLSNLQFCCLWIIGVLLVRYLHIANARQIVGLGFFLLLLQYSVVFGRTVWPALDRGVEGGAPEFVTFDLSGGTQVTALLLYRDGSGYYYLPLEALPSDLDREPREFQYARDKNGVVRHALERNRVGYVSEAKVERVAFVHLAKGQEMQKYLDQH